MDNMPTEQIGCCLCAVHGVFQPALPPEEWVAFAICASCLHEVRREADQPKPAVPVDPFLLQAMRYMRASPRERTIIGFNRLTGCVSPPTEAFSSHPQRRDVRAGDVGTRSVPRLSESARLLQLGAMPPRRGHECRRSPRRYAGEVSMPADGLHPVRLSRRRRSPGLVTARQQATRGLP
jgi:hypothetical protein